MYRIVIIVNISGKSSLNTIYTLAFYRKSHNYSHYRNNKLNRAIEQLHEQIEIRSHTKKNLTITDKASIGMETTDLTDLGTLTIVDQLHIWLTSVDS